MMVTERTCPAADVTMERVGQSVVMYSFVKDGQARGDRVEDAVSTIAAGQTFRVRLQEFMFEDKKGGVNVFPTEMDSIPAYSVVEIMVNPANQGGFDQGYGMQLVRVRPCEFSLYSMHDPLGLYLLPGTYELSVAASEGAIEKNQGLRKVIEEKNTGFFGAVTRGAYMMKYNEDFRLVGPKETQNDPQSKHVHVMHGSSVFAVDIRKEDLLRFANAGEGSEEDGLLYAQFMVDFASAAGALDCYVTCNEYLLRNDPNRSPFTGVPIIDAQRLLDFIKTDEITGEPGQKFRLPFDFFPMDQPYLSLTPIVEGGADDEGGIPRPCSDFSLVSANTVSAGERSYLMTLGDATDADVMSFVFVPKGASTSGGGAGGVKLLGRQDYRMMKKRKMDE